MPMKLAQLVRVAVTKGTSRMELGGGLRSRVAAVASRGRFSPKTQPGVWLVHGSR
jgi:hypothetical protein